MKYVFLKAYLSKNLGDDMFIKYISSRYPETPFLINTNFDYDDILATTPNVRNVGILPRFIDRVFNKLVRQMPIDRSIRASCSALVHIGGSIFIEPTNFKPEPPRSPNKRTFYIGPNFGPYKTEAFYEHSRVLLSNAIDVCFRDSYSYELFKDLTNARLAPDILFSYPYYPKKTEGEGVGISIISLSNRPDIKAHAESYYDSIAEAIKKCRAANLSAKLFSFCRVEGDMIAIDEVLKRVGSESVSVVSYDGDIASFLDEFNSCKYIIASRFHAMVIGWSLEKIVLPIVYSKKLMNVISDVGFSGNVCELLTDDFKFDDSLLEKCLANEPLPNIELYRSQAEEHFKAFDEFITEEN